VKVLQRFAVRSVVPGKAITYSLKTRFMLSLANSQTQQPLKLSHKIPQDSNPMRNINLVVSFTHFQSAPENPRPLLAIATQLYTEGPNKNM